MAFSFQYVNEFSFKHKIKRALWNVCYVLLFRCTIPRLKIFNRWRNLLLRMWGTKTYYKTVFFPSTHIWAPWNLSTGCSVAIDKEVDIYNMAPINIGHLVSISRRAFLCTSTHDIIDIKRRLVYKPITIGNGVWIGAEAYVGPGVTIGDGAIVVADGHLLAQLLGQGALGALHRHQVAFAQGHVHAVGDGDGHFTNSRHSKPLLLTRRMPGPHRRRGQREQPCRS